MSYYSDDQVTLHHGDALEVLRSMPDESVNCVVTSPPYYGLRDYGEPGQYGLEPTPAAYVEKMRHVFAHVRRVLAIDGTLWLNLGDSYAGKGGASGRFAATGLEGTHPRTRPEADDPHTHGKWNKDFGVPDKNLLGLPWRVAFALQDDGWYLRNRIVWHKPNAMPESVTDRLSSKCEEVFLLARAPRYWFGLDAIREPLSYPEALDGTRVFGGHNGGEGKLGGSARRSGGNPSMYGAAAPAPDPTPYPEGMPPQRARQRTGRRRTYGGSVQPGKDRPKNGGDGPHHDDVNPRGRNPGDCWSIPTQPFAAAHFAVMPPAVAERCVVAGCRPGGVVLDPFCGSGTTGMVALKHGRKFVGIDLSAKYLDLALRTRLAQSALVDEVGA